MHPEATQSEPAANPTSRNSRHRVRWAAIGAAVAVCLGAGSVGVVDAIKTSGERSTYTAISSCRVTDTRSNPDYNTGPRSTPLGAGETMTIQATGSNGDCTGIPSDITGVSLNVTVLHATADTHITIWPGGAVPDASSLNPAPGQPATPNAVTTKVAADGTFKVFNYQGSVNVIVDIVGYFQDHNHDDRYYTEAETDTRVNRVAIDLFGINTTGGFLDIGNGPNSGVNLPNSGAAFDFGFTVPPGAGSTATIELLWRINQTGCSTGPLANYSSLNRHGSIPTAAGLALYVADSVPATPNTTARTTFTVDGAPAGGLQPGDSVLVGFFRQSADSCGQPLLLTGIDVTFS